MAAPTLNEPDSTTSHHALGDSHGESTSPHYLPADDDGPEEVQRYIISVLTSPTSPTPLTHPAASALAAHYRGPTGLDLKTASVGDLQSALGPQQGAFVFQAIDSHMPQLSAVAASVKKAARAWGLDILGDREQSESNPASVAASRNASRMGSRVGSRRGSVDEGVGHFGVGVGMGVGHGHAHLGQGLGGHLGQGMGAHLERLEEWDGEREREGRWGIAAAEEEAEGGGDGVGEVLKGSGREASLGGGEAPGLVHRKRSGAAVEE